VIWSSPVIDGYCSRCWSAVDASSVGIINVGGVRDDGAQDPVAVYDPGIGAQPVPGERLQVMVSNLSWVRCFACEMEA
jgi:hypothetical protein